jgi:hypothetical protein
MKYCLENLSLHNTLGGNRPILDADEVSQIMLAS